MIQSWIPVPECSQCSWKEELIHPGRGTEGKEWVPGGSGSQTLRFCEVRGEKKTPVPSKNSSDLKDAHEDGKDLFLGKWGGCQLWEVKLHPWSCCSF